MYTQRVQINLAASLAGRLADLSAQLVNPDTGATVGAPITAGFSEIGDGGYIWTYAAFADNTSYGVRIRVSGVQKASALVEPPTVPESTIGPGADQVTLSFKIGSAAIADADVWVTSDASGASTIAGTLQTNSIGERMFLLDNGAPYYAWMQKDGVNAIGGQLFTANASLGNAFTTTAASSVASWYYGDQDDVIDLIDEENLQIISDLDPTTIETDTARILRGGLWSDEYINGKLNRAVWVVPLTGIGTGLELQLAEISALLTAWWLYRNRGIRDIDPNNPPKGIAGVFNGYKQRADDELRRLYSAQLDATRRGASSTPITIVSSSRCSSGAGSSPSMFPWWMRWW